ncbi:lysylphosphatidylglycerol synthase transmembrane domain-containing protein [Candidatus Nanohalovita haloferacivicina]|uniref:lysylphosphatidylglycerol synthase transmembrane domain-containing protein n=1 Tax=Candidatus Nanohalovita haloferacivicina TaxID=2978046 RepID=UPI00325F96A2|nr:Lysylphosphatidylglycerol synthase TM region / Glycosyl transferase family 2 [Candidatus Nanohalobia archaeon BNXNv]
MKDRVNRKNIFLSVLTSTAILLAIVSLTGLERTLSFLSHTRPLPLTAAFISANLAIVINSHIWKKVLNRLGLDITSLQAVKLVFANAFINNITPLGHAGGEPFIVYHLHRKTEKETGTIFSGILVADVINFTPLITSGLVGAAATSGARNLLLLPAAIKQKVEEQMGNFREGLQTLSIDRKNLLFLSLFSHLSILTDIAAIMFLAYSLGLQISFVPLLLILPLARIANYTPTPGGTGPYEIALTGLLSFFYGIPIFQAAAISVIYRGMTYYFGIIAGGYAVATLEIGK